MPRTVSNLISSRAEISTPSACQRWELDFQRAGDTSSAITGLADVTEKTEGRHVSPRVASESFFITQKEAMLSSIFFREHPSLSVIFTLNH